LAEHLRMTQSEQEWLLDMWDKGVCPTCDSVIKEGQRVGNGRKWQGGFCSLKCYATYNGAELAQKRSTFMAEARNATRGHDQ
jgi:hypothetical protein